MNTRIHKLPFGMAMALIACLPTSERSQCATIVVSADAHVARSVPATNLGSDPFLGAGSGFLASEGGDIDGRIYLKFALPSPSAGTFISSAILSGYYLFSDDPRVDETFSFHLAGSDAWTEFGLAWNNQPGTTGPALASFTSASLINGTPFSWDITSAVNNQYLGDGILSLVLRADDESLPAGSSFKYFASRQNSNNQPFLLDYTIVPEPSAALLVWLGVAVICRRRPITGLMAGYRGHS